MSTVPPSVPSGVAANPARPNEVKLISHSNLFYWWPVWALAFFMAIWTWVEDHRLAIVPSSGRGRVDGPGAYSMNFGAKPETNSLEYAVRASTSGSTEPAFKPRVSQQAWLGAVFVIGLVLTIAITNVPLRGLWSFVAIILIVVLALLISLLKEWDRIFDALGNLHIYINMAGYLFIGTAVFILWALATFVFDRRSYIIFTPGQIRVCEHIGAAVKVYDTVGIHMEKQRDDLFRHLILGFGSGDLIVRTSGAERNEIKLPNVLGIGWRIQTVENMLRERTANLTP